MRAVPLGVAGTSTRQVRGPCREGEVRSDRDLQIMLAMRTHGGSFVVALGEAWMHADDFNSARLRVAFPEYWDQYAAVVDLEEKRDAKT